MKDQLLPYVSESFAAELAAAAPGFGGINPFNSWVLPSLPAAHEDVSDPVFVLGKVRWRAVGNATRGFVSVQCNSPICPTLACL